MIIVTGSITARPETFEALRIASLAHVHRSRTEDGCIAHEVAIDCENPLRLVFTERWRDRASLEAHFRQPGSTAFIGALRTLAAASEGPAIYPVAE